MKPTTPMSSKMKIVIFFIGAVVFLESAAKVGDTSSLSFILFLLAGLLWTAVFILEIVRLFRK